MTTLYQLPTNDHKSLTDHELSSGIVRALPLYRSKKAAARGLGCTTLELDRLLNLAPLEEAGGPAVVDLQASDVFGHTKKEVELVIFRHLVRGAFTFLGSDASNRQVSRFLKCEDKKVGRALMALG